MVNQHTIKGCSVLPKTSFSACQHCPFSPSSPSSPRASKPFATQQLFLAFLEKMEVLLGTGFLISVSITLFSSHVFFSPVSEAVSFSCSSSHLLHFLDYSFTDWTSFCIFNRLHKSLPNAYSFPGFLSKHQAATPSLQSCLPLQLLYLSFSPRK